MNLTLQKPKKIEVRILNKAIHCVGCETRIENVLKNKKGVISVKPSHISQKIDLHFDENKIKQNKLVRIIEKLGYYIETIEEV